MGGIGKLIEEFTERENQERKVAEERAAREREKARRRKERELQRYMKRLEEKRRAVNRPDSIIVKNVGIATFYQEIGELLEKRSAIKRALGDGGVLFSLPSWFPPLMEVVTAVICSMFLWNLVGIERITDLIAALIPVEDDSPLLPLLAFVVDFVVFFAFFHGFRLLFMGPFFKTDSANELVVWPIVGGAVLVFASVIISIFANSL